MTSVLYFRTYIICVGNLNPVFGQAQKCREVKSINVIQTSHWDIIVFIFIFQR